MSVAQTTEILLDTSEEVIPDIIWPPSNLDSNEPPLETYLHLMQIIILLTSLDWCWQNRDDYFAAGNLTIYYSSRQLKSEKFRGPDFFVVLDTVKKPRRSWTVWEEDGKYPHLIIEILSNETAKTDRGLKKQIYQDIFRTPNYFWFDPDSLEFCGFQLINGQYEPIIPNEKQLLKCESLGLYLGVYDQKLRWFNSEGELLPTPEEAATIEKQAKLETEQKLTEMESLLARYQQQFGDLDL